MASELDTLEEFRAYEWRQPRFMAHAELFYLMHELSRIISVHFDRVMACHDLTHSQWWALMHIFEHDGATQSELATLMQLGRASAGSVIERLEKKGWLERRPDPKDNRVRRVYLRDEAVPVFMLMNREGRRVFANWMRGIDSATEAGILAGLRRIKANSESDEPLRE